jgi:hypothetical protein
MNNIKSTYTSVVRPENAITPFTVVVSLKTIIRSHLGCFLLLLGIVFVAGTSQALSESSSEKSQQSKDRGDKSKRRLGFVWPIQHCGRLLHSSYGCSIG